MRLFRLLRLLSLVGWLSACGQSDHFGARPMSYQDLPGWTNELHADALNTFKTSCPLMAQKPQGKTSGSDIRVPASVWKSLCAEASTIASNDHARARAFFEDRFVPYRVNNNNNERGLFTGYYEPVLYGSRHKHGAFKYPLYKRPDDLRDKKAYLTRTDIDNGALAGRGLELVWVDDPVMIFFLQIQGSGLVKLDDGTSMLVGYAGQNNQSYVSLGKIMGDEGLLSKDDINFFTIRQWLYQHPNQAIALMQRNPSYVFFKALNQTGPVGAIGAVVTPQRSLAVDSRYIPYGLPLFMETELPGYNGGPTRPFNRILIAQDTGGAIRGPVRGDVFFGMGDDAEYLAGYMKGRGMYNLLVPKEIVDQMPKQ